MQVLWELEEANVASIIDQLPEPKPAYNTVSTIVRILENKGFVDFRKQGRGHIYFPIVAKSDYSNQYLNKFLSGYFQGSFKSIDRKSTRLNSSHVAISYAVFCLKKKKKKIEK